MPTTTYIIRFAHRYRPTSVPYEEQEHTNLADAWEAYRLLMEGRSMRSIFEEHGIAPEILGDKRIWGFAHKLRTNADRDAGFADLRKNNSRKPASQTREQTLAARVEQLEHELAYTRQEVEFLKKIHTADLEARKSWESRLRQK